MTSKLIVALDFPDPNTALAFVNTLTPELCKLKVGFELFVAAGPDFVKRLVDAGFEVFLDLKFHDIPNTVAAACHSAAELGVWMLNVHACGGDKMMQAARQAIQESNPALKLIAVTVLTSMDKEQLTKININTSPQEQVKHLATLTQQVGLDGVVCSAQEANMLREQLGSNFLLVTPGIRPEGSDRGDQSRVMTPLQAKEAGVSYIVVGRPITQSDSPLSVIQQINDQFSS